MNSYGMLTALKSASYLDISGTAHDVYLRQLLEQASRLIDKYCDRFFYCREGTRYYDGAGINLFLLDDLLSITTLKTDEDGDGTYENNLAVTDYHLYPLNDFPKIRVEINPNGNYGGFASGIKKGVQIAGVFGYGDGVSALPYASSGDSVQDAAGMTAIQTTVTVTAGTNFSAGQTIRIENEQCYVQSIATNTLTIRRAMNGTTATTHDKDKIIYIYEYPMPISQACLITAMRAWKRKDSAYQDIVGSPETGQIITSKGVDPDVRSIIGQYRKLRYP